MTLVFRLVLATWAFLCAAVAIGCGGSSSAPAPQSSPSLTTSTTASSPSPVAYLVYPPSGPYAVSGGPFITLAFAARGINSTYQLLLSPTPVPSSPSFLINLSPTALPSPLASPPAGATGPFSYVTSSLSYVKNGLTFELGLQPVTTYTVSLIGCPSLATDGTCAAQQTINVGTFQTNCGPPPPTTAPSELLASPPNGATGVSAAIGELIVQGEGVVIGSSGSGSLTLTTSSGGAVPVGSFTAAPSPLPTPLASPQPFGQYVAAPIPTLSPTTTYTVAWLYPSWAPNPPSCAGTSTMPLGTFTTQ